MILSLFAVVLVWLFPVIPQWVVFIPAFIEGVVLTPLLVFAGLGRGLFGKLHYWYGAIISGRVTYYLRSDGAEFAPVSEDGTIHLRDGRTPRLDVDATRWYRLGNRPLAFTWDKDDAELVERFADLEAMEPDVIDENRDIGVYEEQQAGTYPYTPAPEVAASEQTVGSVDPDAVADGRAAEEDPYLLNGDNLAKRMHGGDDTELPGDALNKAIKDHGGDTTMSERTMMILGLVALLGGAATGLLYVGVIA